MLHSKAELVSMPRRQLTAKQQVFLEQLLANGGNAAAAYRVAFPDNCTVSSVSAAASRLRRDPRIVQALAAAEAASRQAVDAAIERYEISAVRVADELARLAFTRMPQLADVRTEFEPDGTQRQRLVIKDFSAADSDAMAAITEVRRTAAGEITIKLADKRQALMDLARLKGWVAEKPMEAKQLIMLKIER
jgi:Terminase small subunit